MKSKRYFSFKPLYLAVLIAASSHHVQASYLQPALTQGHAFAGLVWWHEDALYEKDQNGNVKKIEVNVNEEGKRTATAHIFGDIEGIALDYSFGYNSTLDHPTDELVLDFDGNVDVAYSHGYDGVSGNGFTVGTDTFDMTLKFKQDKTLYVGVPVGGGADAAFELTDYENEGKTKAVNLTIVGGSIVTKFDRDFSDAGYGLSVFGTWKNDNGGVKPGYIIVNNESIKLSLHDVFCDFLGAIKVSEFHYLRFSDSIRVASPQIDLCNVPRGSGDHRRAAFFLLRRLAASFHRNRAD